MFGKSEGYSAAGNPKLFETFKPKIEAYRTALDAGILDEYRMPEEYIPKSDGVDVTDIPKKFLSKEELAITELNATDLVKKIATGELTSVEVFKAFAKRATAAHQLTNCAMQIFMDEGLGAAKELDAYFKTNGKTVGPLHGLPISLKEHYNYKGKITHSGYVAWLDNIPDEWSVSVKALKDAGAVFFMRTTEPQTLMQLDSYNCITGYCKNPWNTSLTTGGSSSGEAAMAAMKGSAIGMGSDGGGSIRCPSAFTGVWGIRCTQKRMSVAKCAVTHDGLQEGTCYVLGPIAHSAQDINLFMSAVIAQKPWEKDATVIPLPWRNVPLPNLTDLTIAICYDDGVVKPTTPILRGLHTAREKLEAAGVKVIEWKAIEVEKLVATIGILYNSNGGKPYIKDLEDSGEPLCPLSQWQLGFGCGTDGVDTIDYQRACDVRDVYRDIYLEKMEELGVDFLLTPTYVSVAAKPQTVHYWGYTNLWNLLDFPNVVFPTGLKCDPELDAPETGYTPRSETEDYERALYDSAENFKGAPISLQLTGKRWFDEEVVQASDVVQKVISS